MNRTARVAALCAALAGCFGELNPVAPDAAPDGPADAAAADALTVDAPVADAETPDAAPDGTTDAVTIDAGSDATIDAAVMDAAAMDAGADGAVDAGADVALDRVLVDRVALDVGAPVDPTLEAPRLVQPLSVSRVTRRVRFAWRNAPGVDGAMIEVCRDRACATIEFSVLATGESATPPSELAPGYRWWRARGRRGGVTGTRTSPVWEFYSPPRAPGFVVAPPRQWGTMSDVNGDGLADLVAGAPGNARNGAAYIFPGAGTRFSAAPATLTSVGGASFGRSVSVLRDVNGDGLVDLAVGGATSVSLYLGSATGAPTLSRTFGGAQSLVSAGDVNGDGYGDVFALDGAMAALYLGAADGLGASPMRTLGGTGAASAGDLDGDGFDDVAVQVATTRVSIYRGSATVLVPVAAYTLDAPAGRTLSNLALAGDVNADGLVDLIATATPTLGSASLPVVFLLTAPGLRTNAPVLLNAPAVGRLTNFAAAVGGAGDFNGDGVDDLIAGSNASATLSNSVACVYAGSATGPATMPTQCITMMTGTAHFGAAVAGVGDLDGDGFEDVVVGSPGSAGVRGEVTLYRGRAAGLTEAPPNLVEGDVGGSFGADLAGWR